MQFEFATANRILFGNGILRNIGQLASEYGSRILLVSGLIEQATQLIIERLYKSSLEVLALPVNGEPTVESVQRGVDAAKHFKSELVIGLGGGSALDSAKAIAIMLTNRGRLTDYLEIVGKGQAITTPSLPVIAIPTTAGTGSEVTRNAVIGAPEYKVKVSLRSPLLLPRLAVIDPELTYSMPPELTASTGLDALTQLIEPFVCNIPNPITDGFCREGIKRSASALIRAYQYGHDSEARQDMCIASMLGGMALANARLGAVHGFAGVLGGMLSIPHGVICACLLPIVMEINLSALNARLPESNYPERFREVARLLTSDPKAAATDGVEWLQEVCTQLNIQRLGSYGLQSSDFPDIIKKASNASSMKGNPIVLHPEELTEILNRAV